MKKYELRLAHRQEISELEDEKGDLQRDLQAACSREAAAVLGRAKLSDALDSVRNELAAANVSWAKAKESERAAMSAKALAEKRTAEKQAELTDVTKERDTLRHRMQDIRKAFESLSLAIYPYTFSGQGGGGGSVPGPTGTLLSGLIGSVPGIMPSQPWEISHSPAAAVSVIADAKAAGHPATFGWIEQGSMVDRAKRRIDDLRATRGETDDKVDRLHEAGYSCATQKAKATDAKAQMSSYSGLT